MIRKLTAIFCFVLLAFGSARAQDSLQYNSEKQPTMEDLLRVHEKFEYEVRYSFFKLGTIYVEVVGDSLYHGVHTKHLLTVIKSNPGIPFVGKEENRYHSLFVPGDSLPHTEVFWTDNVDENEFGDTRYIFDRKKNLVYGFDHDEPQDTLALQEPASSGHIVFYLSRLFAGAARSFKIPIYIDFKKGYLSAESGKKVYKRKYDAFDHPIDTYFMEGNADVNGPFGFSGKFKAWFATDDLRIPVEAQVKVWLGHVKVKLTKYSRTTE